jgi:hypothetical protein
MFWSIISRAQTDEEAVNIFKDVSREVGGEDNKSFRFALGDLSKELANSNPKLKEIVFAGFKRIQRLKKV